LAKTELNLEKNSKLKEKKNEWANRRSGASPSITTPSTSRTMGRTSRGEVDPDERRDAW
jgi:hypothetical protein